MELGHLEALNAARAARHAAVLLTDLATGTGQVLVEGEVVPAALAAAVADAFRTGRARIVPQDERTLFLNVYVPPPRIVVIGAVHISQALARLAAIAGFHLTIIDPRTAFATPARFDGVDLVPDWPEDVLKSRPLDVYTALVAVTHDPKIDDFPLQAALRAGCFYVGALGSRKTHARRVDRLLAAGETAASIDRIRAPIGLDIGAASPAEIAVSILAEIIRLFRARETVASPRSSA